MGIDAFDLKEDEIDITPWLLLLCDGQAHNFTIRVSGLIDDGDGHATLSETTGSYWLVTGKAFIWLDDESRVTTGSMPRVITPAPSFDVSSTIFKGSNGSNETLLYEVKAERTLTITSLIHTSLGIKAATWHQSLTFSNTGNFSNGGYVEINTQNTHGYDASTNEYARQYTYPLYAYSVFGTLGDNITIQGTVDRGKDVKILGQSAFSTGLERLSADQAVQARYPTYQGSWLSTTQSGDATYKANETANTSYSFGSTMQDFSFRGISVHVWSDLLNFPPFSLSDELFHRYVSAVNGSFVEDKETLVGTSIGLAPHTFF